MCGLAGFVSSAARLRVLHCRLTPCSLLCQLVRRPLELVTGHRGTADLSGVGQGELAHGHDQAFSGSKAFELNAVCSDFVLDYEAFCTIHMLAKALDTPFSFFGLLSPIYCHCKLLNGSGLRKTAVDIAEKLLDAIVIDVSPSALSADPLQPAKHKIMRWWVRAQRNRTQQVLDFAVDFVEHFRCDWKVFPPKLLVPEPVSKERADKLKSSYKAALRRILYSKSFTIPIPAKFRGVWEAALESLLASVLHDLHGRTLVRLLGNEKLHAILQVGLEWSTGWIRRMLLVQHPLSSYLGPLR